MRTFLSRWSRRAAEARRTEERSQDVVDADSDVPDISENTTSDLELPDPETLGPDSDYRPFLERTVAPALRRLALRRLWRSDPVFSNLDGLNDYDENFAALHRTGTETIAAAVRAGRQYARSPGLQPDEPEANATAETGADPEPVQPSGLETAQGSETEAGPEEQTG